MLGRICALWHRAKHVVVYERTVNASAQFAPKYEDDPGRTRSRRPILRKVREYIELLEPERAYPDFDNAAARSAGFLERARFNSKIINVDSAWSSEVEDYGWQIRCGTAAERARTAAGLSDAGHRFRHGGGRRGREAGGGTGMPRSGLPVLLRGFQGDHPRHRCLACPHRSRFCQYPRRPGDDEKRSPPRARRTLPIPAAATRGRHPSAASSPGCAASPRRLAPAAQKTAINAGRASKPVYVSLDPVTFMRASHAADQEKTLPADLGKLLAALAALASGEEPPALRELGYWDGAGEDSKAPDGAEFSGLVEDLRRALADKKPAPTGIALAKLRTQWTKNHSNYAQIVADSLAPQAKDAEGFLKGAERDIGQPRCHEKPLR